MMRCQEGRGGTLSADRSRGVNLTGIRSWFGVEGLGFGVWGLGFGVWGLGFEV